jgi:hypothetical protein
MSWSAAVCEPHCCRQSRPPHSDHTSWEQVSNKEKAIVQYWVKIVFVDNQELVVKDAIRHTISDDMEVLEVDSAKEVIIVPMKQIKYLACDATVFASKGSPQKS